MSRRRLASVAAVLLVLAGCSSSTQTRVIVGAGTSLVDSRFMAEIVDAYGEIEPSTQLSVVGVSSAEAIALAQAGEADVIVTHNREALDEYMAQHSESVRSVAFASSFFIVADPAIEIAAASLEDALSVIAARAYPFVSRDDGSGTNVAELAAWDRTGIDPSVEPWYIRTGTGMGATLQVADQRHATTLAEHGAFLASMSVLSLVPVANTTIDNPYDLTVIDPTDNRAAAAFAEWMTSPDGVAAIGQVNSRLFDQQVYVAP